MTNEANTPAPKLTEAEAKTAHEKAVRDKNNKEMKAAKKALVQFQDTPEYAALPKNVQEAVTRVCGKVRAAGMVDTFASTLTKLFPKLGDSQSELDIFMETKMGRGEFRKRVRETLKKAEPSARQWIEFDAKTEKWTLLAIGTKQPKAFQGKAID